MTRQHSLGTIQTMLLRLPAALPPPCHILTTLTIHSTILTSSAVTSVGIQEIPLTHPTSQLAARKIIPSEEGPAPELHVRHTPTVLQVSSSSLSTVPCFKAYA